MSDAVQRSSGRAALHRRVQRLRAAVYAQPDPTADPALLAELRAAEAALADAALADAATAPAPPTAAPPAPAGRTLGPATTKLSVRPTVRMNPVPTAFYTLLDPDADPLLTVEIKNLSYDARRVSARAWIEGLSAESARTVELSPNPKQPAVVLNFLPLLFPERARLITQVQRATLHLRVDDLDGKPESHDTFPLVMLARTSGMNAVTDPATGRPKDLTHYYAAWVTPTAEPVQVIARRAAALRPDDIRAAYRNPSPDANRRVAAAVYEALRECNLAYLNTVLDYGTGSGTAGQRARLPREALAQRSANCLDGSILFASVLEGMSLSSALLFLPGHALAGWETYPEAGDWEFVETTMLGTDSFEAALASGRKQYRQAVESYPADRFRVHRVADLRARGIWPME